MKKIAFVSGWYTNKESDIIYEKYKILLNCLYDSAKKHFLNDCDVDFIFITNSDKITIDNVINIKIDYELNNFWHICLMKILSIKYIEKKYDMIFVNDTDQIFVNKINLDYFNNDFFILKHYFTPSIKTIYEDILSTDIELNFDINNKEWTMGNFFGGKSEIMYDLCDFTEKIHKDNFKEYHNYSDKNREFGFYTRYPEELFLIKFIYEKNINFNSLNSNMNPTENGNNYFLSDFNVNIINNIFNDNKYIYNSIPEVKIIHNTKQDFDLLDKIIKYYK